MLYLARFAEGVYVLHAFEKKTRQTRKADIELARRNWAEVVDENGTIRIAKAWIACDVGIALDRGNLEAQMVGGMVYGLSAACFEEITFADGAVQQVNFPDYEAIRMHTAPITEVAILETNGRISFFTRSGDTRSGEEGDGAPEHPGVH